MAMPRWHDGRPGGFRRGPQECRVLRCGNSGRRGRARSGRLVAQRGDLLLLLGSERHGPPRWSVCRILAAPARCVDAVRALRLPARSPPRRAAGAIRRPAISLVHLAGTARPACETACLVIRKDRACCRSRLGGGEMQIRLALGSLAAAVWLTLTGAAQAEPLRIFYFTWVGYGPLFVAQEKGFFGQGRCRGRADQTR